MSLFDGKTGDILVQKSPACTIGLQAQGLCELEGGSGVTVIGALFRACSDGR